MVRDVERDEPLAIQVDVGLQPGDLLLGGADRVGAGDEPAAWWLFAGHDDQRIRELGRVTVCLPSCELHPAMSAVRRSA